MIASGGVDKHGNGIRVEGEPSARRVSGARDEAVVAGSRDVAVAPGEGGTVVVPKPGRPLTFQEIAALRRGRPIEANAGPAPVQHIDTTQTEPAKKPDLEANARAFFAAYDNEDPAAMRKMLAANTVYEDPVFPHLEGDDVARMWKLIAGGSTRVNIQIDSIKVGEHSAEVSWSPKYKFLGAPIVNHIKSNFTFDDEGKITHQKDEFDWRAWGNQTPFPLNLLLRTKLGQKLIQWYLGGKVEDQPLP